MLLVEAMIYPLRALKTLGDCKSRGNKIPTEHNDTAIDIHHDRSSRRIRIRMWREHRTWLRNSPS